MFEQCFDWFWRYALVNLFLFYVEGFCSSSLTKYKWKNERSTTGKNHVQWNDKIIQWNDKIIQFVFLLMATDVLNASDGEWWNLEQLQHFGSKVAWVSSNFRIWWKLRYLAEACQTSETNYHSYKWLKVTFANQVGNSTRFVNQQLTNCNLDLADSGDMFLFNGDAGNNLQEHVCKTSGMLQFFFHYGEVCRDEKMFSMILDRMKMIGGSVIEFSLHLQQQFVFLKLQGAGRTNVSGGLLISGFLQAVQNRFLNVLPTVQQVWNELKQDGVIQADFPVTVGNPVGFADLLMFTFLCLRWRTKQKKVKAKSLQQLIGILRFDFIAVVSKCLNSYIERKVQNDPRFAIARNLPAIRRKSKSERPVRVDVDPETIWALMESAKYSGVSLRQALLLKKDDSMSSPELAGASEAKAEYWSRKFTGLYINRVQTVFKMVTQLSLVADASTHSGKEILVSCAYAPAEKLGCHAVIQHLNTGSLKPSEVDVSLLAKIAKNRKLQRMSAFRQLQAIDKQLALLSDNRLGLDAFSMKDVMISLQEEQKEGEAEEKKKKKRKIKQMEGRFQSRESSEVLGGHNVTNLPESERLAGHIVVDSTRQFIFKLSQKYASPILSMSMKSEHGKQIRKEIHLKLSGMKIQTLLCRFCLRRSIGGAQCLYWCLVWIRAPLGLLEWLLLYKDIVYMSGSTKFIVAFETTNLHWGEHWEECFWRRSCILLTFLVWTTNLSTQASFMSRKRQCLNHFSNQTTFQVTCGKNSEKELLLILAKRMLSMTACYLKPWLSWSRSKTKALWSSRLDGLVGINAAKNFCRNSTLWRCLQNMNLKIMFVH